MTTTFHLIIICGTLVWLAHLVADTRLALGADRAEKDAPPPRVGHRVTVHTKKPDDQDILGVLVGDYTDRLVLENAEYVTPTGGVPLPGRQDIATRDVAWIDVHALVAPVPDRAPEPAPAPEAAKPTAPARPA